MGLIATPSKVNTPKPVETVEVPQLSVDDKNIPDDLLDSYDDTLKMTNEAVRLMSLKRALDIDVMDQSHDGQIKGILEWAKNKGIRNRNQLIAELRKVDYKLGHGDRPKIDRVYEYVRIDDQIKSLVNRQVLLSNE